MFSSATNGYDSFLYMPFYMELNPGALFSGELPIMHTERANTGTVLK